VNENDIYQRGLDKYGESPEALHWFDYRSMGIRFKNLVRDIDIDGRSVLDAGCGMGDLIPYLYTRADQFDYLGVDINPGFIEIAKKRYKGHRFEVGNPFSGKFNPRFDVVFSSGVMNIKVNDWQKHRLEMIKALFDLSTELLVFNMAGGYGPQRSDRLIAYADADKIVSYCSTLTAKLEIRAGYLDDDFTVLMYKRT
jgi:SAM-dependent methyltransferase